MTPERLAEIDHSDRYFMDHRRHQILDELIAACKELMAEKERLRERVDELERDLLYGWLYDT